MSHEYPPPPDETDLYRRIAWCARVAARPIYRRYRRYVQPDDLRQEAWAWALEHTDWVRQALERSDAYLVRRLRSVAERYARREKAAAGGYSPADEAYYSLSRIMELLPDALDPQATPPTGQGSEVHTNSELYGEWETSLADIRAALKRLPAGSIQDLRGWVDSGMPEPTPGHIRPTLRHMQTSLGGPRPETGDTQ